MERMTFFLSRGVTFFSKWEKETLRYHPDKIYDDYLRWCAVTLWSLFFRRRKQRKNTRKAAVNLQTAALLNDWPSWRGLLGGRSQDRWKEGSSLASGSSCSYCSPAAYRSGSKSHPCTGRETWKKYKKTVTTNVKHKRYKIRRTERRVQQDSRELPWIYLCSHFYLMAGLDRAYPMIMWSFSWEESGRSSVGPSPIKMSPSSVMFSGWWRWQHGEQLAYDVMNQHRNNDSMRNITSVLTSSGIVEALLFPPPNFFLFFLSIFYWEKRE